MIIKNAKLLFSSSAGCLQGFYVENLYIIKGYRSIRAFCFCFFRYDDNHFRPSARYIQTYLLDLKILKIHVDSWRYF